jgi:hypothetical protein
VLVTRGTDHQTAQINLQQQVIDDDSKKWVFDCVNNTKTSFPPSVTVSSPALTERDLKEHDFHQVGNFLVSGVRFAKELRRQQPAETFKRAVGGDT